MKKNLQSMGLVATRFMYMNSEFYYLALTTATIWVIAHLYVL